MLLEKLCGSPDSCACDPENAETICYNQGVEKLKRKKTIKAVENGMQL